MVAPPLDRGKSRTAESAARGEPGNSRFPSPEILLYRALDPA